MTAKESLLKHIKDNKVEYVQIRCVDYDNDSEKTIQGELEEVLPLLDFEVEHYEILDFEVEHYEIFGTIWYTDGSWSTRNEYNGVYYWEHLVRPIMPDKNNQYKVSLNGIPLHE